jgi:hypothetical protein
MTSEDWYRVPDEKVRPGDVFSLSPSWRALKPPLRATGNAQKQKERDLIEVFGNSTAVPAKILEGMQDGTFLVPGRMTIGILLSRGCEVDHGKIRQLAIVRPLSEIQGDALRSSEEHQADVIDGKAFANHYLPAVPETFGAVFPDSYVDFRYVCTVAATFLIGLKRVVALTRPAVQQLYFGWMRHTTGLVPTPGLCPECKQGIPLLVEAPGALSPAEDW